MPPFPDAHPESMPRRSLEPAGRSAAAGTFRGRHLDASGSAPSVRAVRLFALLAFTSGCAISAGPGYALGNPDAAPRALKVSGRGPMSREGPLLVGAELGVDVDDGFRARHGAVLGGVRIRDYELGASSPSLELALAAGVGRETFDATGASFGPLMGARVDAPFPLFATPSPSSSRLRALYLGAAIVPYVHGDLIFPVATRSDVVRPGLEGGLALRLIVGTDMTLMDTLKQVF